MPTDIARFGKGSHGVRPAIRPSDRALLWAGPASASHDALSKAPPSEAPVLTRGPSDGLEFGEADALEERARARQKAGDLDGAVALPRFDPDAGRR